MSDYIRLYKGDSSDFADQRTIKISFTTPYPLTGYKAKFVLQGVTKQFNDISSGEIDLTYSYSETQTFALGKCYGKLKLVDPSDRIQTVANNIPFEIVQTVLFDEVDSYSIAVQTEGGTVNIVVESFIGLIGEAPEDGVMYARKDGAWEPVGDEFVQLGTEIYTTENSVDKRTIDLTDYTLADLANLTATLIKDLKETGVVQ